MEKIADIFQNKAPGKKAPAYQWQDLALQIINELGVPNFKRSSVFKICKEHERNFVEKCFDDTKELAEGDRWKYFFKLATNKNKK
ncbi:hypothetical protein C4566_02825 [Candidatus Parcubacteria bacterium]|nr:MAG: hypothetical protein C4566_02825 [Candidatus Parcubacteria bacterium]